MKLELYDAAVRLVAENAQDRVFLRAVAGQNHTGIVRLNAALDSGSQAKNIPTALTLRANYDSDPDNPANKPPK